MFKHFVKYLCCPVNGAPLKLISHQEEGENVIEGELLNTLDPQYRYPIIRGVPRFLNDKLFEPAQRDTVESFSQKWSLLKNYAAEGPTKSKREAWYFERFGFTEGVISLQSFLRNATKILEAGTGVGVDTDMLAKNSDALIFGVDISSAIDVAYKRFSQNERILLVQADIAAMPFRKDFFDIVSCDQVLHHTPDPEKNFSRLVNHLSPNGRLLLYVYKVKGALREFSDNYLREQFTRSSEEACLDFCHRMTVLGRSLSRLNAKVAVEEELPEFGIKKGEYDVQRLIYDHMFKCFWNEDFDFETNLMVNYDWYRPVHAFRYTPEDINAWLEKTGLTKRHFNVCPSGISAIAEKV